MSKARIGHKYTQWSKSARFPLAYVKPPENLITGDKITRLAGMSPFAWQREDNRTEDKRKLTEREIADADAMGRSDQVRIFNRDPNLNFNLNLTLFLNSYQETRILRFCDRVRLCPTTPSNLPFCQPTTSPTLSTTQVPGPLSIFENDRQREDLERAMVYAAQLQAVVDKVSCPYVLYCTTQVHSDT